MKKLLTLYLKEVNVMGLIDSVIGKRRHIVVNKKDLVKALEVINQNKIYNMDIGSCGWDDLSKWFIHFNATNKKWGNIVQELNVIRVWKNTDIPDKGEGVYSTD